MEFKGTKGGWSIGASGLSVICKDSGVIISYAGSRDILPITEQYANIKLSAYACDLLEALQDLVIAIESEKVIIAEEYENAIKAIEKALK